jgi:hypothetical protein
VAHHGDELVLQALHPFALANIVLDDA